MGASRNRTLGYYILFAHEPCHGFCLVVTKISVEIWVTGVRHRDVHYPTLVNECLPYPVLAETVHLEATFQMLLGKAQMTEKTLDSRSHL